MHSKIDETFIANKKTENKKKQCVTLDMKAEIIENEKTKKCINLDMDETKTTENKNVILNMNEIEKKEKTDNKGVYLNIDQIKMLEKTNQQDINGMDIDFDIEDELETNNNKTNEENANLDLDKIIGNGNEETSKLQKQGMDEIDTQKKTDNEGINSIKDIDTIKINENTDEQYIEEAKDKDVHINEVNKIGIEKTFKFQKQVSGNEAENLDFSKNENSNYHVKQSVLVRYYIRSNWKYYVGFIEKVDVQQMETYYSIAFLKTVQKPTLRFLVCKRDRDVVPSSSIVKTVNFLSVKENREYLVEECDEHYF